MEEEEWVERSNIISAEDEKQTPTTTTTQFNAINIDNINPTHSTTTETVNIIQDGMNLGTPMLSENPALTSKTKVQNPEAITKTTPNRTKLVRLYSKASLSFSLHVTLLINFITSFVCLLL